MTLHIADYLPSGWLTASSVSISIIQWLTSGMNGLTILLGLSTLILTWIKIISLVIKHRADSHKE